MTDSIVSSEFSAAAWMQGAEVDGDQPHVTSTTVTTADSASHLSLISWTGTYCSA